MPVKVKICGITNRIDGEAAVDLGADALGFNLWHGSKRYVDIRAEAGWIAALPSKIFRVAVMVNPSEEEAESVFALPYIDVVQFHGGEGEEFCSKFAGRAKPFIKAVALKDRSSCDQIERFQSTHILLDAFAPGEFGGTGKTIDWDLAAGFVQTHPQLNVLLSGGLNPRNVRGAIQKVHPYGVDIASGVEQRPGKKDYDLMKAFIAEAKAAETASEGQGISGPKSY